MLNFAVIIASLMGIVGCGQDRVDLPNERKFSSASEETTDLEMARASRLQGQIDCLRNRKTGCLSGQIVVAPYISVEGKEFFDADALGRGFADLVDAKSKDGHKLSSDEYKFTIEPPITNESFAGDFHVYVKGDGVQKGRISKDGTFKLDHMQAGKYDLRVQKKFLLKVLTPESAKGELAVEKVYCFSIYAEENGVELIRNTGHFKTFDDFKLRLLNVECSAPENSASITL